VVIALGSYSWAFAINTLSFFAVIAAIAPLRLPKPSATHEQSLVGAIRGGIRFARRDPGLRATMTYLALNSLLAAPFIALVPAMALKVFDEGKTGTSVLVTAQGAGAVTMALALGSVMQRFGRRRVLLGALSTLPAALVAYAFAPTLELAAVAIFFVGFTYLGCLSSFTTIAQLRSPPHLRGRIMSVNMVLLGTLYPLGSVVQGALADDVGLRVTTAGAAIVLAIAFVGIRVVRPRFDRHIDDELAPGALGGGPGAAAAPAAVREPAEGEQAAAAGLGLASGAWSSSESDEAASRSSG
jgi:MFS family permease